MSTGHDALDAAHFRRVVLVVGVGIFFAGLGWPAEIGRLPFFFYLKNELHLSPKEVSLFWTFSAVAWYIKPLAGLFCDSVPLLGTRRRWYLVAGSVTSSLLWIAFAAVPRSYGAMLAVMVALNLALVVVSVSLGGMLVEEAQKHGATGRLSSLRAGLEGLLSLVAGPVTGWLAERAFGWTIGVGAALVFSLAPLAYITVLEPARARRDRTVWATARQQLANIVRSRPMWGATALLFLVHLAPGFSTPLLFYQRDVLKLEGGTMGWLQFFGGAGALLGAAAYSWLCRRIALYPLLVVGVLLNAASVLFYLGYHSRTAAIVIQSAAGIVGTIGLLPLYDLAVRAAPKGSESFSYALMMSIRTIAEIGISDPLGSYLYGDVHLRLEQLVWINAGSTLAVLLFLPLLPVALMAGREGDVRPAT